MSSVLHSLKDNEIDKVFQATRYGSLEILKVFMDMESKQIEDESGHYSISFAVLILPVRSRTVFSSEANAS